MWPSVQKPFGRGTRLPARSEKESVDLLAACVTVALAAAVLARTRAFTTFGVTDSFTVVRLRVQR
jgi:hypothetical protein